MEEQHILLRDKSLLSHELAHVMMNLEVNENVNIIVDRQLVGDMLVHNVVIDELVYKITKTAEQNLLHYKNRVEVIEDETYEFLAETADDAIFESILEQKINDIEYDPEAIKTLIQDEMTSEFGRDWEYDDGELYHYYLDLVERFIK